MIDIKKIKIILSFLEKNKFLFDENVCLKEFSYFKTGGKVKLIVYPKTEDEIRLFLKFTYEMDIDYKIIGDTSNLLFLDDKVYGLFLSLKNLSTIKKNNDLIFADAGASLPALSRKALLWELSGFEGLEGIPGSVGGAVIMNAGAYGNEIKDHLINVSGFKKNGEKFVFNNEECLFKNRNSIFRQKSGDFIILSASFRGNRSNWKNIYKKMELFHSKRHKYQDFLYPTLGSIFSTNDIYKDLACNDKKLKFLLFWYRKIFYSNKIRKETPINRIKLNNFICNYYDWKFENQPFSNKTLNCITNRGQHTNEIISYINLLKSKLPQAIKIENEIIKDNILE